MKNGQTARVCAALFRGELIEKLKVIDFNHGRCFDYDELMCIEQHYKADT